MYQAATAEDIRLKIQLQYAIAISRNKQLHQSEMGGSKMMFMFYYKT